ncbi:MULTISPECIES: ribonuclease III [Clostridium]|uniref:Ribonuclease 3 n=1 Tax=Clostridium cadaveris TaxID=1529 RepID=A0A1I2J9P3_9CLOT|nr:ribonuclease III [Clostridium cadaveris]MDU4953153.1 ribonuclease III [Clostridium sp.]MDM8311085.1 ribonuclease III [Clostridium cadaveris]MDY4950559.1 ribonuclease III [Clostridium cadaveris]NME64162.1 ribonuclease III [Clostridium cadaveris]NWK11729.1 ribonuclease III [Clostridium cadaveris]
MCTYNNVDKFEKVLNVNFLNKEYLETALTHSSYANQHKNINFNERLEFLGDSVLQLSVTEYLYNHYKEKKEGELTKYRALIVCENSLFILAKKWDLGKYIRMSKGEEMTGGRERTSIQADCVEAIFAALYLDKGMEFAKNFILYHLSDTINMAVNNEIVLDYKTKLQETMQKNGEVEINYELIKFEGPPHRRKFYTKVLIDNKEFGRGEGFSKKEAEQNSAKEALRFLEVKNG